MSLNENMIITLSITENISPAAIRAPTKVAICGKACPTCMAPITTLQKQANTVPGEVVPSITRLVPNQKAIPMPGKSTITYRPEKKELNSAFTIPDLHPFCKRDV